ncbi:unannotated protein [freshwater metagenome]|uniref:Unannotated protein n=1 Tax=freshwater metagenome TaxID=449393 RepID=A0A6J7LAD2_9ZZZZ
MSTTTPSFAMLGVPSKLVDVLTAQGIDSPFPIQTATLRDSLAGRDVLGRGRTGSGKTLAFGIPLVARLAAAPGRTSPKRPRALVLLPTRELATQVHQVISPLAQAVGLTTTTVFGGVGQRPQEVAFARGVDIVVACPGRLEDLMKQGFVRLDEVQVTVLDEADHMADLGFLPGVKRILDTTPKGGQRLLFSATLDNGVDVLVKRYLTSPVTHSVDDDASTEPDIEHHVLTVDAAEKPAVVRELASGVSRSMLFTRTKHHAKTLARNLTNAGIPAVDLHGNLSQGARDRNLAAFRDGEVRVLVATDVAARGIHVDDIALVVHVDPPTEHKAYLHRSGRTARAGASGVVVTLQTHDQRGDVHAMTRKAGIKPITAKVSPGAPELLELTGPRAEHVTPPPREAAPPQQQGGGRGKGTPRRKSGTSAPTGGGSGSRSRRGGSGSGGSSGSGRSGGSGGSGKSAASPAGMSAAQFSAGAGRARGR